MCYSYEFKMNCVKTHCKGRITDTLEGITRDRFIYHIRNWGRILDAQGEVLKHKSQNKY